MNQSIESRVDNPDSPFTEIFALLVKCISVPGAEMELACSTEELRVIGHHINNVLELLTSGLQDLCFLMGEAKQNKQSSLDQLCSIEFFVSIICNLMSALHAVKSDTSFILRQRGKFSSQSDF